MNMAEDEDIRRAPERVDLFLSGGGFRAALGALGVILFLLHDGRWPSVRRIVSVSGGGLVNAHLALTRPSESRLSEEILEVFERLTSGWTTRITLAYAMLPVLTCALILLLGLWQLTESGLARAGVAALIVGVALWVLLRLWLHGLYKQIVGSARLDDLTGTGWTIEHVFVATDLSRHGSLFFVTNAIQAQVVSLLRGVFDGRDVRFEKVIRASTALPPILPPTRLRMRSRPAAVGEREYVWAPVDRGESRFTAWLADGGVTGNLGVQFDSEISPDNIGVRDIAMAKTLAGTARQNPYTCPRHEDQLAWDCAACTRQTWIVDASGLQPGESRLYNWLLGMPLIGVVVNGLRSLQVMYESALTDDQALAGDNLVGVVRTQQVLDRLGRKNNPVSASSDSKERMVAAGSYMQFIENAQTPSLRRAMGFTDLLLACMAARTSAASVRTGLTAVRRDKAAQVVASGYLNALLNAYGPTAMGRADDGVRALSDLLGPKADLDTWWAQVKEVDADRARL